MLEIDSPGIAAVEIADKLLVGRRIAEWILGNNVQKSLSLGLQPAAGDLLRVLSGAVGER
jgi:hypothetical protein